MSQFVFWKSSVGFYSSRNPISPTAAIGDPNRGRIKLAFIAVKYVHDLGGPTKACRGFLVEKMGTLFEVCGRMRN